MKHVITEALATTALASLAAPAIAQGPAPYEDILVTATRRVEGIQDVPVSVATVSAELMAKTGALDVADIAILIPNFEFSSTGILPNLYVRGIGTGSSHSVEQSVGRFIDDVYIGRAAINIHALFDTQSFEVLRGPQGTLFGKNTLAGAVIINTGDPTQDFEMGVTASISDFSTVGGTTDFEAFVSGPLTETLSARAAFKFRDRDGYIENLSDGPDGGAQEDISGRIKLRWEPTDRTSAQLKVEHMTFEYEGQTMAELVSGIFPGGPAAGQPLPVQLFQAFEPGFSFDRDWRIHLSCDAQVQNSTFCPGRDQDTTTIALTINHEFEGLGTLTSISAFQTYDFTTRFSTVDAGIVGGSARVSTFEDFEGFTQEFRFTSEEFETFDYIIGVYFEDSQIDRRVRFDNDIGSLLTMFPPQALPPVGSALERWKQDTQTFAIFGQGRYRITEQLSAIVGLRWAREEKDFLFDDVFVPYNDPFSVPFDDITALNRTESRFVPSATLRYEANDDVMFFFTFSQGFKAGGFADRAQPDPEFDEEVNNAFELGMKASWLDGALTTNISIFRMKIRDLQVARSVFGAVNAFEVENAAEALSQGVEIDVAWSINENWTVGGNFAYTDAEYQDFPNAVPAVGPANAPVCRFGAGTPEVIQGATSCNFAGQPLIFAPEFKGGGFIEYTRPNTIGEWTFGARTDVNFSSSFSTELTYNPNLEQDSYALINASVRMTSPDDRFTLSAIGRNLTEQHVIAWGFTGGFTDLVAPRAPREIILQARFNY